MKPPYITIWTQERVELLKRLHNEGLSASDIAARLKNGLTRSAIIGKIHRLGLARGNRVILKPAKRPLVKKDRDRTAVELAARPALHLVAMPLPVETRPASVVKFADLTAGQCRFPFGRPGTAEFGFCGAPSIFGGSYCLHHHRVCSAPVTPSRPRRVLEVVPTFADAEKEAAE